MIFTSAILGVNRS